MILHDFRHDARQIHFKHTNFWNGCTCNASLFRQQRFIFKTSKQLNENLYVCYTVVQIDGKWVSFLVEIDFSLCYSLFLFLSLLPMFYLKKKLEIGPAFCLCNHFYFLKKAKKNMKKNLGKYCARQVRSRLIDDELWMARVSTIFFRCAMISHFIPFASEEEYPFQIDPLLDVIEWYCAVRW